MASSSVPHVRSCTGFNLNSFCTQIRERSTRLSWVDCAVFTLILAFGAFQFVFCLRAHDSLTDDAFYADAARSILEHGFYGINGYAETNMPPGLSWLLALLGASYSHLAAVRVMVVFGTLGYLASYELLRGQMPRWAAATICLVLISSPIYFALVTRTIASCYPYFFTTTAALLAARELQAAKRPSSRFGWGILLAVLVGASLLFVSAGIALLGALIASAAVTGCRDYRRGFAQLKTYAAALLFGIAVQGFWMHHAADASAGIGADEWPIPGFPHSYLSQLKVKSGNYPELGLATPGDVIVRIAGNVYDQANLLSQMILRRSIYNAWMSVLVLAPILLVGLGWWGCVWSAGGGLQAWYFAGYEFIYLVWPWGLEPRFFLPIAPLACFYLWRGADVLLYLAKAKPRMLGTVWLPMGLLLAAGAWGWVRGDRSISHAANSSWEDEFSLALWTLSALLAGWMLWAGPAWLKSAARLVDRASRPGHGIPSIRLPRTAPLWGVAVTAALVVLGALMQIQLGRENRDLHAPPNRIPPDAAAAHWIQAHTDAHAVIMARSVPTACHYAKRKVIWFPPSSNPTLLMAGIRQHGVDFLIVVHREGWAYYFPADEACFAPLLARYPERFRLVCQGPAFRIFLLARAERAGPDDLPEKPAGPNPL
jgi:hypothetical protein